MIEGIIEIELDGTREPPRMIVTGGTETLREPSGELSRRRGGERETAASPVASVWSLADWAQHLADNFRRQEREAGTRAPGDRPTAIAQHILATLADTSTPRSADLLELIDRIRAGTHEVVW